MDFLECGICHIAYNEDEHRPRNSPCGHEFCTTCLRSLIKDGEYICPKCREKFKVTTVEELPVAFGLIDVIRAFRANTISVTKDTDLRITGATNEHICNIHCKTINHFCSSCQLWICDECLDSHTKLIGCSTRSATEAMGDLKYNTNKSVDHLRAKFKNDTKVIASMIQEHTDKRKEHLDIAEKHGEEVKKLHNMLQQGAEHMEKVEESNKCLNETNSPLALIDSIKVVTQRKQTVLSWAAKTIGTDTVFEKKQEFLKALEKNNDVYVEKIIKDERKHGRLSQHDGNIFVHTFQTQDMDSKIKCMPLDQLEKITPSDASLVFLELSLGEAIQGKLHLHLNKNLPNTRKYIIQLVMGERGQSFNGITLACGNTMLYKHNLPFRDITFKPDRNGKTKPKNGDLFGCIENGYIKSMFFGMWSSEQLIDADYYVFGSVVDGMEVLKKCYDNYKYKVNTVEISDCGLIIDCD